MKKGERGSDQNLGQEVVKDPGRGKKKTFNSRKKYL